MKFMVIVVIVASVTTLPACVSQRQPLAIGIFLDASGDISHYGAVADGEVVESPGGATLFLRAEEKDVSVKKEARSDSFGGEGTIKMVPVIQRAPYEVKIEPLDSDIFVSVGDDFCFYLVVKKQD